MYVLVFDGERDLLGTCQHTDPIICSFLLPQNSIVLECSPEPLRMDHPFPALRSRTFP